jgi:hypothetical protein
MAFLNRRKGNKTNASEPVYQWKAPSKGSV